MWGAPGVLTRAHTQREVRERGSLVGRTVVAWLGAGERTLGACSWCIQLLLLVALVGNEREEGSLRPGVLAWLGAVVTCSWW